jgi:uncharacterized membrane protein YbaN (DUF454 family)
MIKTVFLIFGTLSLFLGVLGIFIPGLPTTPFLLLSAGLYFRGSQKAYNLLIQNRYIGSYIMKYRKEKGVSLTVKLYAIILMWCMIIMSTVFFIQNKIIDNTIYSVGVIGTIVMGFLIPTIERNLDSKT